MPDGGRMRSRSYIPVILLAVCMTVVLYSRVSYYNDKIVSDNSTTESKPLEHVQLRDSNDFAAAGAAEVVQGKATQAEQREELKQSDLVWASVGDISEEGGETKEQDEQHNTEGREKKPKVENAEGEGGIAAVEPGEGGIQESWDDDQTNQKETETLGGLEPDPLKEGTMGETDPAGLEKDADA
ncbi:unnamed protein product, partial [Sphacelaria rigidula]